MSSPRHKPKDPRTAAAENKLHPRNRHRARYDFARLIAAEPARALTSCLVRGQGGRSPLQALRRIRRYVPPFGNMDISAVILFLIILFIQLVISRLIANLAA